MPPLRYRYLAASLHSWVQKKLPPPPKKTFKFVQVKRQTELLTTSDWFWKKKFFFGHLVFLIVRCCCFLSVDKQDSTELGLSVVQCTVIICNELKELGLFLHDVWYHRVRWWWLLGFTYFSRVLACFAEFYRVPLPSNICYWVLQYYTGSLFISWVLLDSTRLNRFFQRILRFRKLINAYKH